VLGGASPLKPAWEAKGERGHASRILPDGDAQGVVTLDTTTPASVIEAGVVAGWSVLVVSLYPGRSLDQPPGDLTCLLRCQSGAILIDGDVEACTFRPDGG
jgi:hypothetical protein